MHCINLIIFLSYLHIFILSSISNATPNLCWVFCALLGVLCIIGCSVQLIREVFSRLHSSSTLICLALRRLLTFCLTLTRQLTWWFVCPRRSSFKRFLRSATNSVFVNRSSFKSMLNFRKAYLFKSFPEGLLSICV